MDASARDPRPDRSRELEARIVQLSAEAAVALAFRWMDRMLRTVLPDIVAGAGMTSVAVSFRDLKPIDVDGVQAADELLRITRRAFDGATHGTASAARLANVRRAMGLAMRTLSHFRMKAAEIADPSVADVQARSRQLASAAAWAAQSVAEIGVDRAPGDGTFHGTASAAEFEHQIRDLDDMLGA